MNEMLTLVDDSVIDSLDKCLLHSKDVYIYTVVEIKEFLSNLLNYRDYLKKIKIQLKNPKEVIKYYIASIIREINEKKAELLKNKVKSEKEIQDWYKQLNEKLKKYEQNLIISLKPNELIIKDLLCQAKRLKKSACNLEKTSNECVLNASSFDSVFDLKKLKQDHSHFETEVKNLINDTNRLIFNNKFMLFEVPDDTDQLGFIYTKQSIDLDQSSQIDLNEILLPADDIKFDVLNSGAFIFICKNSQDSESKTVILFDPIEKKLIKRIKLKKNFVESLKKNNNLFAIQCCLNDSRSLIIMDDSLHIIKEKFSHNRLVGVNQNNLFFFNSDKTVRLFDWSLNELQSNIEFQDQDPLKPFYIKDDIMIEEIFKSKHDTNNQYLIHTYSFKNESEQDLIIYKENGEFLRRIKLEQKGECKLSSSEQIVVLNGKKLKYFDLDGNLINVANLFGTNINSIDFTFDKNNRIYIFDYNSLKIYF
jgi:hypothetical protein